MNAKPQNTNPEPEESTTEAPPVRVPDIKPTPKAEAKAANKLPKAEQLEKFEQHLEVHDPGNQPA